MDVYETLSPFETDVLEVAALFYMPVRLTSLARVLRERGAKTDAKRAVTEASLKITVLRLEKLGLLTVNGKVTHCRRLIAERVTQRMVQAERFNCTVHLVYRVFPYQDAWGDGLGFRSRDHAIAHLRLAYYAWDFDGLNETLDDIYRSGICHDTRWSPISDIINNPFDPEWLSQFPEEIQGEWLGDLITDLVGSAERTDEAAVYCRHHGEAFDEEDRLGVQFALREADFMRGDFAAAADGDAIYVNEALLQARCQLVMGNIDVALDLYETCLAHVKKNTRKRKPKFESADWLFFVLALVQSGEAHWARALELATWGARDQTYRWVVVCQALVWLIEKEAAIKSPMPVEEAPWRWDAWANEQHVLGKYVIYLCEFFIAPEGLGRVEKEIEELRARAKANGYQWLEAELSEMLCRVGAGNDALNRRAKALRKKLGCRSLLTIIEPVHEWERTLRSLRNIGVPTDESNVADRESRLVWLLTAEPGYFDLQPKEQRQKAKGGWTKGRNVALRRLYHEGRELGFLTSQDLAVCTHIEFDASSGHWGRVQEEYYFKDSAAMALAGHPHVFCAETNKPLEIVAEAPELTVRESGKTLELELKPALPARGHILLERIGDTRVVVYEFTPEIVQVADALGGGVQVPITAKEEVLEAVGHVSSLVTVHSDIGVGGLSIPLVDADPTPIIQLFPSGEGLKVHLRVQPLPTGGPLFFPGNGGESVIAEVKGERLQAKRALTVEKAQADAVIAGCETLAREAAWDGEWELAEPEDCLEFLVELEGCNVPHRVEWPKGERFQVQGTAGLGQFRAKITGGKNWFEVAGDVVVDKDLVMDMQRLLELTSESSSRFVALEKGQYLALTQSFRKKLDELRGMGTVEEKGLRLHALAAPMMEELVEQAGAVKANKKWKDMAARLQQARACQPDIPTTLRATLRDYQVEGFHWLAQLAAWGVGACLADDMGLGKTVQILALMLHRAPDGPQLVVAPTSVCMNWEEEACRFAPTLHVRRFGVGDRDEQMADLGPFDVVVVSYGLLQNEGARFKAQPWESIVLDEAQAIKNMATKRSKVAMELDGGFKIVATGTPIENHLGELWNLFRFINPGFLGSLEQFNQRFATPIEKEGARETRHHLRQLIQPFMLRRLKGDVLDELPTRTDIVLHVELSEKERAFYEALRLQAINQLSDADKAPGKNHVRILAEIMRLRRACCHARLVEESSDLPSAKLKVFQAVLEELLENGHKALVFSQFVGHLTLVRKLLENLGVTYQYLDGSTSAKARKESVAAFQGGEGELFLISLKAGGVGLNLTAADYVIHMDPWWNPAVEDQASDRAHRIGQQRPVTVYRLVAKDTIEDQIVDLHHQKRDLANSLLEGSDMAGKISAEQLLALIRSDHAAVQGR